MNTEPPDISTFFGWVLIVCLIGVAIWACVRHEREQMTLIENFKRFRRAKLEGRPSIPLRFHYESVFAARGLTFSSVERAWNDLARHFFVQADLLLPTDRFDVELHAPARSIITDLWDEVNVELEEACPKLTSAEFRAIKTVEDYVCLVARSHDAAAKPKRR